MASNGVQISFQQKLFKAAEGHGWNSIFKLFQPETVTFADISKSNDEENGFNKTILHYACAEGKTQYH